MKSDQLLHYFVYHLCGLQQFISLEDQLMPDTTFGIRLSKMLFIKQEVKLSIKELEFSIIVLPASIGSDQLCGISKSILDLLL